MRGIIISTLLVGVGLILIGLIYGDLLIVVKNFDDVRGYIMITLLASVGLGMLFNALGNQG
jgi:hypothetical protein